MAMIALIFKLCRCLRRVDIGSVSVGTYPVPSLRLCRIEFSGHTIRAKLPLEAKGSAYAPNGIAAPSGGSALSRDRRRYAFGYVICADADAFQARPPSNSVASYSATTSTSITLTIPKIISSHGHTSVKKE